MTKKEMAIIDQTIAAAWNNVKTTERLFGENHVYSKAAVSEWSALESLKFALTHK